MDSYNLYGLNYVYLNSWGDKAAEEREPEIQRSLMHSNSHDLTVTLSGNVTVSPVTATNFGILGNHFAEEEALSRWVG
jgi:hypothetical protein